MDKLLEELKKSYAVPRYNLAITLNKTVYQITQLIEKARESGIGIMVYEHNEIMYVSLLVEYQKWYKNLGEKCLD